MRTYLLLLLPSLSVGQADPTICLDTTGTCYQGAWMMSDNGARYASFQGIQYARHPVGELRFKPPQPFIAGEALFNVSGVSEVVCPQVNILEGFMVGQEECLLLNIYIPDIVFQDAQAPLPVMAWIHGGALLRGSGRFEEEGPQYFMDKEVIIVTINYRLGVLGFLSMGTELVPGNSGLRDQHLALSWVNENIASFGGNPEAVTIFGESAGSLSVHMHILSPMSKGLFQRAIMQSQTAIGTSHGPVTITHALEYADMLTKALGCEEEVDVLVCLQAQDMGDIVNLNTLMDGNKYGVWMPVPDHNFTSSPFLPGNPEQLMKSGEFNTDVEVVVGTNADEGILYFVYQLLDPAQWANYRDKFDVDGPRSLFNIANASEVTEEDVVKAHTFVEYYVGSLDSMDEEHKQDMCDMFTDAGFLYGTYKTINYMLEQGMTVYQYILTYEGEFSFSERFGVDPEGVCHADDLLYIWDSNIVDGDMLTGNDVLVREIMTTAWANFATYGDPTPPGSVLSWTPQESPASLQQYWNITGPAPFMATSLEIQDRMALWEKVVG